MTTMFDKFFGVPQAVVRSGQWGQMKPTEQSLYICLMHESERYCTRAFQRTDAQMRELSKLSARSFCNARKKLQEKGLVVCKRGVGNAYCYTLCNPETRLPWPGDPETPVRYVKKRNDGANTRTGDGASLTRAGQNPMPDQTPDDADDLAAHGVPLRFH